VLIADPEPAAPELLERQLADGGFEVLHSGEAHGFAGRARPALVSSAIPRLSTRAAPGTPTSR